MRPASMLRIPFALMLQPSPGKSFMALTYLQPLSPGSTAVRCGTIQRGFPAHAKQRRARRAVRLQAAASTEATSEEYEGTLLELDVVEYRTVGEDGRWQEDSVELGSYLGDGKLHPLLTREESGPSLFFHDEDAQAIPISGGSCRIVRVLDEVYYSQRIIEDRVKNPHGEEAEDSFLVEEALNPTLIIRVEQSDR